MYGGRADQGLFSEGFMSQTALAFTGTAPSGAGRAGATATDPGTGVGGKQKRRGVRKLSCSRFVSAPSSQDSFSISPSSTDFSSATRASPVATAKPAVTSWMRKFLKLLFWQFIEESASEIDRAWKNHLKTIAPKRKDTERWKTQTFCLWPPLTNIDLPDSSQSYSDSSLPSKQPGSMEEQEDNFVLSLGANTSKCSPEANQTRAPTRWSGATRGGPEVVIVPVLFGFIFLLGMVGNTLVLVVLGRLRSGRRPSRSTTNIFILNLSIADFSFLLFCIPFQATIYSLPEWIFGAFFCKWVHYLAMATMLVSIFTLVAMSVDRYIAVVHAKRSSCIRSKRNAALGVGVIWLLSLLIAIPVAQHQALMSGHQQAPKSSFCWEHWADGSTAKQMYKITILLVGYLLPLVLITCCYAKVLYHLHTKVKNISKKSERSKKKTAQTVLLVVAVFLLSWLPHHIITMWAEFGQFPLNNISFTFRIISHCLAYGNSCINPIIYAFLSENFRKACRQVFTCKFFLRPVPTEKLVRIRMENFSTTHSTTNM